MKWSRFLEAKDNHNESVASYFTDQPDKKLIVSFVRHSGCTYCREMLKDLGEFKKSLKGESIGLLVVHMSSFTKGDELLRQYGLEGVGHISDPKSIIYRIFGLNKGSFTQLFGFKSILRGFSGVAKHGIGLLDGDGTQMPGVFLVNKEGILKSFVHSSVADRVDYEMFLEA